MAGAWELHPQSLDWQRRVSALSRAEWLCVHAPQLTDEEAILQGRIQFSRGPFEAFRLAVAAPAGAGVGKQQQQ